MFENNVLMKIFGVKKETKLQENGESCIMQLYSSLNIIRNLKLG